MPLLPGVLAVSLDRLPLTHAQQQARRSASHQAGGSQVLKFGHGHRDAHVEVCCVKVFWLKTSPVKKHPEVNFDSHKDFLNAFA